MKLDKSQRTMLGVRKEGEVQTFVWNKKLATLYEPIDDINFDFGEPGQSFPEFLEMQKREPNEEGTGRFKTAYFDRIEVVFITKEHKKPPKQELRAIITRFISTFLRIKCQLKPRVQLRLDSKHRVFDTKSQVIFYTKSRKGCMDVFDVLQVLKGYKVNKTILLAFIESSIHEDGLEVDGRALGDGVAAISYDHNDLQQNLKFYCQTALHQTLHTLGFDHCIVWKCLMNAYTNFQSWLCPGCLRKLYHELSIKSAEGACEWIKDVLSRTEPLKDQQSIQKGQKIMKFIS